MYRLVITSYYNSTEVEYQTLESIANDYFPRSRFAECREEMDKAEEENHLIEFLETCLDALDIPFSPDDDSPCTFKIIKL